MFDLMMSKDEIAEAIAKDIEQQPWCSPEVTTDRIKAIVIDVLGDAFYVQGSGGLLVQPALEARAAKVLKATKCTSAD